MFWANEKIFPKLLKVFHSSKSLEEKISVCLSAQGLRNDVLSRHKISVYERNVNNAQKFYPEIDNE